MMNKPELEGTAHLLDELDSNTILFILIKYYYKLLPNRENFIAIGMKLIMPIQ